MTSGALKFSNLMTRSRGEMPLSLPVESSLDAALCHKNNEFHDAFPLTSAWHCV